MYFHIHSGGCAPASPNLAALATNFFASFDATYCSMKIADEVAQLTASLPEPLAREVLDFVRFLRLKERNEWGDWMDAQSASLRHVWDNPEDEAWNDLPLR